MPLGVCFGGLGLRGRSCCWGFEVLEVEEEHCFFFFAESAGHYFLYLDTVNGSDVCLLIDGGTKSFKELLI